MGNYPWNRQAISRDSVLTVEQINTLSGWRCTWLGANCREGLMETAKCEMIFSVVSSMFMVLKMWAVTFRTTQAVLVCRHMFEYGNNHCTVNWRKHWFKYICVKDYLEVYTSFFFIILYALYLNIGFMYPCTLGFFFMFLSCLCFVSCFFFLSRRSNI